MTVVKSFLWMKMMKNELNSSGTIELMELNTLKKLINY